MKCKRCNRELKNIKSIERCFGKRCFELTFGKEKKAKKIVRGYFY